MEHNGHGMTPEYRVLDEQHQVRTVDVIVWKEWMMSSYANGAGIVGLTRVGDLTLHTFFTGLLDNSGNCFETVAIDSSGEKFLMAKYPTWQKAEEGHINYVALEWGGVFTPPSGSNPTVFADEVPLAKKVSPQNLDDDYDTYYKKKTDKYFENYYKEYVKKNSTFLFKNEYEYDDMWKAKEKAYMKYNSKL